MQSSSEKLENTKPPWTGWNELGLHNYIRILIIAALFYYLFRNEIEGIVRRWATDSSWSHGFLIPLFSLYFINQHKHKILHLVQNKQLKPNYLGLLFMICGIVFYPVNIVHFRLGYLQPMCMIATLGAIILLLGGWRLVKYSWLPVVFLVFAVPLPPRYYDMLTMPMRKWAATVVGVLLDLVPKLQTEVSGVVINVIYKGQRLEPPLNVAEACSGMRLLMAFLALGVAATLPFLTFFDAPIGALIIAFALFDAWRRNKRAMIEFSGPLRVGSISHS